MFEVNHLAGFGADANVDPYWGNVVLLMHMDGANNGTTFTDVKGHTVTRGGSNIVTSTAQSKFGGSSMYNPGTSANNYLSVGLGATDGSLSGDFTIEFFAYHNDLSALTNHNMLGPYGSPGNRILLRDTGTNLELYYANASKFNITNATAGITAATMQHYAICRAGTGSNNCTLYIDGNSKTTWTDTSTIDLSTLILAAEKSTSATGDQLNGYMDEVRITKGVCRYTANFTVPTAAFPDA